MQPDAPKRTVFVVEDNRDTRDALAINLEGAGFRVEAFDSAEGFLLSFGGDAAGCLVVDMYLPDMDGLALQEELARRGSRLPVIFITGYADVPLVVRAMRAGAIDFLEKPITAADLLGAVLRGLDRRPPTNQTLRREAEAVAAKVATLSEREHEVFEGLVAGKRAKEIAFELGISSRTVEVYRANAMGKLGARTPAELIRMGLLKMLLQDGRPRHPD